ncbi:MULTISPECIES: peptidylprolyl isomerase [unclassified Motilimonas]|uniref:FKBP-type peptidyl-prolyl cis-trans isomerase n=1 Tax=Motilimonas TaxID=1914248 RepID=UPI001E33784E|nr:MULTISPECIES: peptidylprolyl isomerase [unclassified Motilimonas]MCE0557582.1 peptidylprolyl isomerase [Motilimonas sp. E26]MDO6526259.1 peptidylprolyl isomerase [Motilimonas sp. 1_MG-2023]
MIEKNTVVQFSYELTDQDGTLLETSKGEAIAYLHGQNNMLAGVEAALEGKAEGDQVKVTLTPEESYGERQEGAVQRVPAKHLQGAKKWLPGMIAQINTDNGARQVTVVKVGKFMITVDTNHPFAGKTLTFDMKVVGVRPATEEEIAHKHAHGEGGHQH